MSQIGTLVDLLNGMPPKDPRYALFLGAGASVSSGIPATTQLVQRWQRRVFLDRVKRLTWELSDEAGFRGWQLAEYPRWKASREASRGRQPSDYALLFDYAFPDSSSRQGFIERICGGCEPGPGYIYLTSLTIAGYFHTFLTTNFDDLIHDALFRYGGLKPVVCAFDSEVSSIRAESPRPKIIKLHGDFLFDNLRNVGPEVRRLDRNMELKFSKICEHYGLIVVGYGGADQSVMAPLLTRLHDPDCLKHGLHWCVYNDGSKENGRRCTIPEEVYRLWKQYPDKVHLYDTDRFDVVMEALYSGCRCSPPPELSNPEERALYARLRDGIENADQTWRLTPRFSALLQSFRMARARPAPKAVDFLDAADEAHRTGQDKLKREHYEAARQDFTDSIRGTLAALKEATTDVQRVRAYRRLSGSRTSLCETRLKESGRTTEMRELTESETREITAAASTARDEARTGLSTDAALLLPPELRGHRLNLWFNGLQSYAYLIGAGIALQPAELREALSWLEGMSRDELHGDEFTVEMTTAFGGAALLGALHEFHRREADSTAARAPT